MPFSSTEIELTPDADHLEPSLTYLGEVAKRYGISATSHDYLTETCRNLVTLAERKNISHVRQRTRGNIKVSLEECAEGLKITIHNRGTPIFGDEFRSFRKTMEASEAGPRRELIGMEYENRGRHGQAFEFTLPLEKEARAGLITAETLVYEPSSIRIREAGPTDAGAISRLFFEVYRYAYINEYVYYPEKLREMMAAGTLRSLIAETADGRLAGHIGILRWNESPPVFEAALGIVDPRFKSGGLFGKIFSEAISVMKNTPMQYCVYDFVTNHDFSQRMAGKFGYREMALYLGNQVSETQAKLAQLGIGVDSENMDRYSLLVAVDNQTERPFGKSIILPTNLGEACDFLLRPLGVNWIPAPRFYPLPAEGDFSVVEQTEQRSMIFDFFRPGRAAANKIVEKWKQALENGIQYLAVDVPVDSTGLGQLYDLLAQYGFFMAGLVPYHFSERLGIRFQFLSPTKVDFEGIKMYSESSKRLLKMVRENYERNRIL